MHIAQGCVKSSFSWLSPLCYLAAMHSILVAVVLLACAVNAEAQQPAKVYKITWLGGITMVRDYVGTAPGRELVAQRLRGLGYVDGKNIRITYHTVTTKLEKLSSLADELVQLKPDVIVATSITGALAAKKATSTVPIVFYSGGDPVAAGLVDSLARPGKNVTGFTLIDEQLVGNRLELLKETVPNLTRVGVLWNPRESSSGQSWKESMVAARKLGLQIHSMEVDSADKFEGAFNEAVNARSAALAVIPSSLSNSTQKQLAELAAKYKLPAISRWRDFVASGGLMSYGPDRIEPFNRVAAMIDQILKGTKPADIPVEQPTRFDLVINLKTAKALSRTIPPIVLMEATKVIK